MRPRFSGLPVRIDCPPVHGRPPEYLSSHEPVSACAGSQSSLRPHASMSRAHGLPTDQILCFRRGSDHQPDGSGLHGGCRGTQLVWGEESVRLSSLAGLSLVTPARPVSHVAYARSPSGPTTSCMCSL